MTELPKSVRDKLVTQPHAVGSADEHPDPDLLTAFVEQALSGGERERIFTHLAQCTACREIVSLAIPPVEAAPAVVARHRTWLSIPVIFRWGAALATTIVVLAAVLLYRPEHKAAMSEGERAKIATSQQKAETALKETSPEAPSASTATQAATSRPEKPKAAKSLARHGLSEGIDKIEVARTQPYASTIESNQNAPDNKAAPASSFDAARTSNARPTRAETSAAAGVGGLASKAAPGSVTPPPPSVNAAAATRAAALAKESEHATAQAALPGTGTSVVQGEVGGGVSLHTEPKLGAAARVFWNISPAGKLQRSGDEVTWQTIELGPGIAFRVVASIGPDVWAGGSGGALYHSPDDGISWQKVPVGTPRQRVSDTITRLQFKDLRNGTITTTPGDQWITHDAGRTWARLGN